MDMCIEPLPEMGESAHEATLLCLVVITSHADLFVYKSFNYSAEVSCSEGMEGAAGKAGAAARSDGDAALPSAIAATRRGLQAVRFRKQAHDVMLRGEALWDDFFADEMELGDPTREETLAGVCLCL